MKKGKSADSAFSDVSLSDMPVEKQLFRNLRRVHDSLHVELFKFFKEYEITIAQFDLLETILVSPSQALSIQQLAANTVSHQPNVTRSVGALVKAGWVRCTKSKNDNRMVLVRLTKKGERLMAQIQKPLLELHVSQFKALNTDELIFLNELMKKISHFQERLANEEKSNKNAKPMR